MGNVHKKQCKRNQDLERGQYQKGRAIPCVLDSSGEEGCTAPGGERSRNGRRRGSGFDLVLCSFLVCVSAAAGARQSLAHSRLNWAGLGCARGQNLKYRPAGFITPQAMARVAWAPATPLHVAFQ
jgi:hypothetical protein